jgi:hypothetical protein
MVASSDLIERPMVASRIIVETNETTIDGQALKGRVVLGFKDGSELVLQDTNPLVGEFVRAADRMMRPAGWRKLFGPKVGL